MDSVRKLTRNQAWEDNLKQLDAYMKKNGNVIIPLEQPLGEWLRRQRIMWERLSEEKKEKLLAVNQNIEVSNENLTFQRYFDDLLDYQKRTGNINVPYTTPENKALCRWIARQRQNNREYLDRKNKWTEKRKKEWKNRQLRLMQAFNFDFKCEISLGSEEENMRQELLRLMLKYEQKHKKSFMDYLIDRKKIIDALNEHKHHMGLFEFLEENKEEIREMQIPLQEGYAPDEY